MGLLQRHLSEIKACKSSHFSLADQGILDKEIKTLVDVLNENPTITELDLSINNLSDICGSELVKLKFVKVLNLSRNNMGIDGFRTLIQCDALESLNLSRNNLAENGFGFEELIPLIKMKKLDVSDSGLSSETINLINEAILRRHLSGGSQFGFQR